MESVSFLNKMLWPVKSTTNEDEFSISQPGGIQMLD